MLVGIDVSSHKVVKVTKDFVIIEVQGEPLVRGLTVGTVEGSTEDDFFHNKTLHEKRISISPRGTISV